jgi:RNA polymerase sigma factor (TIGR02999 family)
MEQVTQIFNAIEKGDARGAHLLLPLVYEELRRLAAARMARESPGQTLEATALVHEAYIRLLGDSTLLRFQNRGHFFAAAAEAMRRILIDNARRKQALKHGGERLRVELEDAEFMAESEPDELLALDEALEKLAAEDREKADLVKLRYFAGLSLEEAAAAMNISRATASRYWTYARAFLHCELK